MSARRDFAIVAGLLGAAFAVGGSGVSFPELEMLLQAASIGVLAYFTVTRRAWRFNRLTTLALAILGGAALLPLIQLIPLPPAWWQQLPGRDLPAQLDQILGWSLWRPWSFDVEGTIRSFLRLLPAAAIFVGCLFLSPTDRARLLWVFAAFALLNALLGIIQLVTGGALTIYPSAHIGHALGLFVNRNHTAAFLAAAIPISAALAGGRVLRGRPVVPTLVLTLAVMVIYAAAILGTTSRMGFGLLPIALLAALVILFRRHIAARLTLPSIAAVAAVAAFIVVNGGLVRTLSRFSSLNADARFMYWADISWAVKQYGLFGTGIGSFVPVYQTAESLGGLSPAIINHAHNDYLELLLEGGLPAVALLILFLALLTVALVRACRSHPGDERGLIVRACGVAILLLLLASLVDYPLRMPAVGALMATLCAIVLPQRRGSSRKGTQVAVRSPGSAIAPAWRFWARRVPALAALAATLVLVVQAGVSARALLGNEYEKAIAWAPWSARAHAELASSAMFRDRLGQAFGEGLTAVRLSPVNAPAVRTIGLVRLAQGSPQGRRLMDVAARLGWRDPITQLWLIDAAERSGEPAKGVQRAEALMLQQILVPEALRELLGKPVKAGVIGLLAQDLADQPAWRSTMFDAAGQLSNDDLDGVAQVVTALGRTNAPATPDDLQPLIKALIDRGDTAQAKRFWRLLHPTNPITNGDFEQLGTDDARLPRFWKINGHILAHVAAAASPPESHNHAFRMQGVPGGWVLSQVLMLDPGQYVLGYQAGVGPAPAAALRWALVCDPSGRSQAIETPLPPPGTSGNFHFVVTVPDQDCAIQTLVLKSPRGTPEAEVWIDNLRLDPAAR